MSAANYGQLLLALLAAGVLAAAWGWSPLGQRVWAPAALVLLAASALCAALPDRVDLAGHLGHTALVTLAGALAVLGGGPVTSRVFGLVDRGEPPAGSMDRAGQVLRGGAWIGALERIAIFVSLTTGWPEGLAVVLALKGLGRYPELRAAENGVRTGAAERFIIGTFTSVLWAAACAGVVVLVA
ncbi:hypothetical protein [Nocardioides panaciterrulae]|uniref:Uncharacterized protein n=1 Tax=Nocardioides panaciterrulae TaxID=661492 RepID=A0A7Y9E7H0_9ACTN|nr:hypothetical protein [Nocardioides panaciterrulae]NYD42350.1 hypothetical protein [Nocardioides panaciterrulae]